MTEASETTINPFFPDEFTKSSFVSKTEARPKSPQVHLEVRDLQTVRLYCDMMSKRAVRPEYRVAAERLGEMASHELELNSVRTVFIAVDILHVKGIELAEWKRWKRFELSALRDRVLHDAMYAKLVIPAFSANDCLFFVRLNWDSGEQGALVRRFVEALGREASSIRTSIWPEAKMRETVVVIGVSDGTAELESGYLEQANHRFHADIGSGIVSRELNSLAHLVKGKKKIAVEDEKPKADGGSEETETGLVDVAGWYLGIESSREDLVKENPIMIHPRMVEPLGIDATRILEERFDRSERFPGWACWRVDEADSGDDGGVEGSWITAIDVDLGNSSIISEEIPALGFQIRRTLREQLELRDLETTQRGLWAGDGQSMMFVHTVGRLAAAGSGAREGDPDGRVSQEAASMLVSLLRALIAVRTWTTTNERSYVRVGMHTGIDSMFTGELERFDQKGNSLVNRANSKSLDRANLLQDACKPKNVSQADRKRVPQLGSETDRICLRADVVRVLVRILLDRGELEDFNSVQPGNNQQQWESFGMRFGDAEETERRSPKFVPQVPYRLRLVYFSADIPMEEMGEFDGWGENGSTDLAALFIDTD